MKAYFIRRLLLLPITLLGITIIVFFITRIAPGGPMDQLLMQSAATEGQKSNSNTNSSGLSDEDIEAMEEEFGIDKSAPYAYCQWLGILPRENYISKSEFRTDNGVVKLGGDREMVRVVVKGEDKIVEITRNGDEVEKAVYADSGKNVTGNGWEVRLETPLDRKLQKEKRSKGKITDGTDYSYRAVVFKPAFSGIIQGDFRNSRKYQDPVMSMIGDKIPISLYFGILSSIIIYGVCIPLGIVKAIRHRTFVDNFSSILIFLGYSIPGFALGALMLTYFGVEKQIVPLFGLLSPEYESLSILERISNWAAMKDLFMHTVLPLICYVIGGFAMTTMMMKNNLMDNLAADYVRTAMAKGVPFKKAVFGHAFRNSMIPIATGLGGLISIFVGGSMLIEKVFDIDGFGLMQFNAVLAKDMPLIMGTLTISAFLMLLGNILSDIIVAMIDPRIKFN
ncbi:MAG: microcin C transport system permease protein [Rubritalea sp.]|jgi:microcin C transport system permease protein